MTAGSTAETCSTSLNIFINTEFWTTNCELYSFLYKLVMGGVNISLCYLLFAFSGVMLHSAGCSICTFIVTLNCKNFSFFLFKRCLKIEKNLPSSYLSFSLSVRPSDRPAVPSIRINKRRGSYCKNFHEIYIWLFLENLSIKFKFH
jgi:hypothetical protein